MFFKKKKEGALKAVFNGEVIDLAHVPDPVFAEKMMGDGVAIIPDDGHIFSPVTGEIVTVFDTFHAIGIRANDGVELLIHIGLDTVNLKGRGFDCKVRPGDKVKVGALLMTVDLDTVKNAGLHTHTPVVITNMDKLSSFAIHTGKAAAQTDNIITYTLK